MGHFTLEGGKDSANTGAKIINQYNPYVYVFPWGNYNAVYDSYRQLDNYDMSNIYFHGI
jgi:hypothetical protein